MIQEDRLLSIREIEETTRIPKSSIHESLKDHLKMKKLCARWAPHILSPKEKHRRVEMAEQLIPLIEDNRYLWTTGDESWFMFHQTENKRQNMVWLGEDTFFTPLELLQIRLNSQPIQNKKMPIL